jgi:hypothetical protein
MSPIATRSPVTGVLFSGLRYGDGLFKDKEMPVFAKNFFAGAIGGVSFASCAFFFDFLKVRLQNEKGTKLGTYSSTIKHLYSQEGIKGFTRGLGITLTQDFFRFGVFFTAFREIKK